MYKNLATFVKANFVPHINWKSPEGVAQYKRMCGMPDSLDVIPIPDISYML
jgi:hypothetical protein